jgi:hypothetical protein
MKRTFQIKNSALVFFFSYFMTLLFNNVMPIWTWSVRFPTKTSRLSYKKKGLPSIKVK